MEGTEVIDRDYPVYVSVTSDLIVDLTPILSSTALETQFTPHYNFLILYLVN